MSKKLQDRDGPVFGISNSMDLFEKLKHDSLNLCKEWNSYDAFNFLITSWHLHHDWVKSIIEGQSKINLVKFTPTFVILNVIYMNMITITREDLKERIQEIEFWPELSKQLDWYLADFLYNKDIEMISILLKAGANPNPHDDLDCWLHYFLHEYIVGRTLHGELILNIVETLLIHGANPNRIWSNNQRAYDYSVSWKIDAFTHLLEKYGVNHEPRETI